MWLVADSAGQPRFDFHVFLKSLVWAALSSVQLVAAAYESLTRIERSLTSLCVWIFSTSSLVHTHTLSLSNRYTLFLCVSHTLSLFRVHTNMRTLSLSRSYTHACKGGFDKRPDFRPALHKDIRREVVMQTSPQTQPSIILAVGVKGNSFLKASSTHQFQTQCVQFLRTRPS